MFEYENWDMLSNVIDTTMNEVEKLKDLNESLMQTSIMQDRVKASTKQESITYLTEKNIKRMFRDKQSYQYYMKVLWLLRELVEIRCQKYKPRLEKARKRMKDAQDWHASYTSKYDG